MRDAGMTFTVTDDHLKLLARMCVTWDDCEYGAPQIDPKRPYGNSWVEGDVAEILGWGQGKDEDESLMEEQNDKARAIHEEMETVLQILLLNPKSGIRPGKYQRDKNYDSHGWVRGFNNN